MDEEERMQTLILEISDSDIEPCLIDIFLRLYWWMGRADWENKLISLKKDVKLEDVAKVVHEPKFFELFTSVSRSKNYRMGHLQEKVNSDRVDGEKKLLQSVRLCSLGEFGDTIFRGQRAGQES